MPEYEIPENLVAMLKARLVIPFIGAGFSASMDLPGWEELLKKIADEVQDTLNFAEVKDYCHGDYLQIAEYYLLKSDRSIGPLRHSISRSLMNIKPLTSSPHIELVNLGAQLIYTTNYDDAIETTYRLLEELVNVVALPKHIATLDTQKTQVVKYHGDLRHEKTLVLTESSYYSRLDFESPMDLKFRSDILGRSVLFMGYGFRDLNIRVIWYRLMRMMKDIHPSDLPTSYIVIFGKNPVLELLYQEVGIRTLVLDPRATIKADAPDAAAQRNRLFSQFMLDLADRCSTDAMIPGQQRPQYASPALFAYIQELLAKFRERRRFFSQTPTELLHALQIACSRKIIPHFAAAAKKCLASLVDSGLSPWATMPNAVRLSLRFLRDLGHDPIVTFWIARGLGFSTTRETILSNDLQWEKIWSEKLDEKQAEKLLSEFQTEIGNHDDGTAEDDDIDIAYAADVAARIKDAQIVDESLTATRERAADMLAQAAKLYPTISSITPNPASAPDVDEIIAEIQQPKEASDATPPPDDIPF
jgi:hypothetical protein